MRWFARRRRRLFRVILPGNLIVLVGYGGMTALLAVAKERKIEKVRIGMTEEQVTDLLGVGRPDTMGTAFDESPSIQKQRVYRGNPSLRYGRFEDFVIVRYADGVVYDFIRIGL